MLITDTEKINLLRNKYPKKVKILSNFVKMSLKIVIREFITAKRSCNIIIHRRDISLYIIDFLKVISAHVR